MRGDKAVEFVQSKVNSFDSYYHMKFKINLQSYTEENSLMFEVSAPNKSCGWLCASEYANRHNYPVTKIELVSCV